VSLLPPLVIALALLPWLLSSQSLGQEEGIADSREAIHFEGNFDAAMLEAAKNNTPVFIVFYSKEDPRCADLVGTVLRDPEVVALSRRFICLAACPDEHDDRVVRDAEGVYRTVCSVFLYVTCAEHQRVWNRARGVFFGDRSVAVPLHLFVNPDGTMMDKVGFVKSAADLVRAMNRNLEKMKPEREDGVFHALDENERKFVGELRRIRGSDPSLRRFILEKLLRWKGAWVYPKLQKWAETEANRAQVIQLIREMGFKGNGRGEDYLLAWGKNKDPEIRLHAAVSLETIALSDRTSEIRDWFHREKNLTVKANLLRTLAACDTASPEIQKIVEKSAKGGNPILRRNAAVALGTIGRRFPDRVRPLLEKLAGDRDMNVSACACWSLGWMRSLESLELLTHKMNEAGTYRMIILLEDAIRRVKGQDTFGYTKHLEKYAGDTIVRGEKWPPKRRDWRLGEH